MMSPPSTAGAVDTPQPEKGSGHADRYVEKTGSEELMGSLSKALEGVNVNASEYQVQVGAPYAIGGSGDHGSGGSNPVDSGNRGDMGATATSPWGSSFPTGSGLGGFSESHNLQGMIGASNGESSSLQQGSSLLKGSSGPIPIREERQPGNNDRNGLFGMADKPNQEPVSPVRKQSLELFLSQSPSKTLGEGFLKLRDPTLSTTTAEAPGMSRSGSVLSLEEVGRAPRPVRRRNDSPSVSVTGTSTSSRSGSPFPASNEPNEARRTIHAYPVSDLAGAAGSRPFVPQNATVNGLAMPRVSSHSQLAHQDSQGLKPTLLGGVDFSNGLQRNGYGVAYDAPQATQTVDHHFQQQQSANAPQVLYMAVPTPDGRGQMLQPVQIAQLPGQPTPTFVLPPSGNTGIPSTSTPTSPHQPNVLLGNVPSHGLQPTALDGAAPSISRSRSSHWSQQHSPNGFDDHRSRSQNGHHSHMSTVPGDSLTSMYSAPQRPALDELLGNVRRLSRDQVGCRLLQQALDEEGPEAATLILNEGLSFWGEAMVDPFGNYLFQKILEKISPEERVMLVKSISARLVNASLNLHGTRSVQKVVELCATDEDFTLTSATDGTSADVLTCSLEPAAARLCIDSHGNHVIQRILLKLSHNHSKFVFDAVAASVGDVARHRHGCCVIQRCLDSPPSQARSHLVARIVEKSLQLMQDAYGNYVVQYVLDVCSEEDVQAVCESVVGGVSLLAIQKFSSNVMEKCLERCNDHLRELYLHELSDPDRIRELMMDPFGNYVVQRALSVASHAQAVRLVEAMRPHLLASQPIHANGQRNGGMRNTAGGRRIMSKICRRFPNFTLSPDAPPEQLYAQHKGNRAHHQGPPSAPYHAVMPPSHQQQQYVPETHGGGRNRAHAVPSQQQPVYYDAAPPHGYYDPAMQAGHPHHGYNHPHM